MVSPWRSRSPLRLFARTEDDWLDRAVDVVDAGRGVLGMVVPYVATERTSNEPERPPPTWLLARLDHYSAQVRRLERSAAPSAALEIAATVADSVDDLRDALEVGQLPFLNPRSALMGLDRTLTDLERQLLT